MPRYHFHTDDRADVDGTEMESLAHAKCQAVKAAGQTICDHADAFWDKGEWKMTVTDETGLTMFNLLMIGTEAAACRTMRPESPGHSRHPLTGRSS
jgi:hypothetical protein